MKKRILISGAGPAGLSTALQLDRDMFDIHVVERSDSYNSMGFSIILWKPGYEVLKKTLGGSVEFSSDIDMMKIWGGNTFTEIHSAHVDNLAFSVQRSKLIDALATRFEDIIGSESIRFGTYITDIEPSDSVQKVTLSDGSIEHYDLVICADGMHSDIRNKHFETTLKSGPYKIIYQWVEPGSNLDKVSIVGFKKDVVYLIQTTEDKALLAYYIESDKASMQDFEAELKKAIDSAYDGNLVLDRHSRRVFSGEEVDVSPWYKGGIVLMGDASHGHPPTLAMGTSMAFEDAAVLANQLNTQPISTALQNYTAERSKRINQVYTSQHIVENMFFSHSAAKTKFSEFVLKAGGKYIVDHHIRHLVT